jgi:hypothetical protein
MMSRRNPYPIAGDDERPSTRTIAHVLIEQITQPGEDRANPVEVADSPLRYAFMRP